MAEEPHITTRGSDPQRTSYGSVVFGLKVLIDALAEATGLRASVVVAVLGGLAILGVSVVTGAGMVLFAAKGKKPPESGPPNFPAQKLASAPPSAPSAAANRSAYPQSGMMVIPGLGPSQTPPAEESEDTSEAEDAPEDKYDVPTDFEAPKKGKKALLKEGGFGVPIERKSLKDGKFGILHDVTSKPLAQSTAQMEKPKEAASKVGAYAQEVSKAYGKGLPGIPEVPEGRSLGPAVEALKVPKRSKEKIEAPVDQKEVPEVGPGRKVTDDTSGSKPKNPPQRITAGTDPLSTPIDVNKIQLDPSRTHNVDQTVGVQIIGK